MTSTQQSGAGPVMVIPSGTTVQDFASKDKRVVHRVREPVLTDSVAESYPSNNYWYATPLRRGPGDRQRFEAAGWRYDEIQMDAHSFLATNEGRLSLRGIPMPEIDKWEPAMSVRSQVEYWFHANLRQDPAGDFKQDMVVRVWSSPYKYEDHGAENYVSPASNDTNLWDFQVVSCPQGIVTIGMLRPLRRGSLAAGWWREGNWNPTNKDFRRNFSHKPCGLSDWTADDVGGDQNPPIDHDEL